VKPAGQSATPVTAGIYCRISLAADDDTTKVDDQERLCRDTARNLGWKVGENYGHPLPNGVYQDNNRSAWKHDRKREAWDQMLRDIEAGQINAIVVYHGDRLVRQPMDLEILIQLSRTRGIKLASPTGVRDLNNDDDQFTLGIEANVYRKESASTSRRRKQQYERWRREGRVRPGGRGGRAYGFATDGETHIEAECEHIREMAAMLLAGEPTGALVKDAAERGALTPAGRPFTHGTVRKMLARPRYAGLMPDGENKAAWEPALERRDWERVCEILAAKSATFSYATNARRWLLSGIAVCGACGGTMQLRPSKGRGRQEYANGYACNRAGCRKAYRSALHLDAYVGAQVVGLLNNPLNPRAQAPQAPDSAAEWARLAEERAATEAAAKDYKTSPGRLDILMARLDSIDARMKQLRELETSDTRSRLMERYRGITREQWENDLPLDVKRALVAACFTVTVLPASGRGPGFRVQDVRVEPAA
jgi:site-specific DNA recombinase